MAARVDNIPDNTFATFLDRLESDTRELRTTAAHIGSASIQGAVNQTTNAYDWSGVLPTDPNAGPGFGIRLLNVTATANNMDNLFGDLIVRMYVGSLSNWYRPSSQLADLKAGAVSWSAGYFDSTFDLSNRKNKSWNVLVLGNDSTTVYLKFFVVASDTTSISVSVIS